MEVFPGAFALKGSDYGCLGDVRKGILIASSNTSLFGVGPGGKKAANNPFRRGCPLIVP